MKLKNIITFSILFALSFSIMHEYAFAFAEEEYCSVKEFAAEINGPVQKGDICDIHFEYHIAFILPNSNNFIEKNIFNSKPIIYKESYKFLANLDYIKPPIA